MRRLFFYGGRADNFITTSQPFISAAGGRNARIALLFPSGAEGWDRNLAWYCDPWRELGAKEIIPVHPADGVDELTEADLREISRATGIFMCGGDTRLYHRVYAQGPAKAALRAAYESGVPYAGLSAGALIAPETCSIWGDHRSTATNTFVLGGSEDGCDEPLVLGQGLGFLKNVHVEAHFAEEGGFPRLADALELTGCPNGLGFDNPICVEICDEREAMIHGQGRVYLVKRLGGMRFETQVFEPGAAFLLPE